MKSITSTEAESTEAVSSGQLNQCVNVVADASRKAAQAALEELARSGVITKATIQRVLGHGDKLTPKIHEFVKKELLCLVELTAGCLKRISAEPLTLEPEDGTATIAKARKTFPGWIDPDFRNYGIDVKGKPTKKQNVEVHEMVKDGDFKAIFTGISEDLDSLCLSQAQIIQFCEKHRNWLRTEVYGTFFLFKVGNEFFVARVYLYGGAWRADARRFSCDYVWAAQDRRRVLVPQRVPSDT